MRAFRIPAALLVVASLALLGSNDLAAAPSLDGLGPQLSKHNSQPSCVGVLASFVAPQDFLGTGKGLKVEVEFLKSIAEVTGIPPGQVARKLAGKHGTVDECFAFLFG